MILSHCIHSKASTQVFYSIMRYPIKESHPLLRRHTDNHKRSQLNSDQSSRVTKTPVNSKCEGVKLRKGDRNLFDAY